MSKAANFMVVSSDINSIYVNLKLRGMEAAVELGENNEIVTSIKPVFESAADVVLTLEDAMVLRDLLNKSITDTVKLREDMTRLALQPRTESNS